MCTRLWSGLSMLVAASLVLAACGGQATPAVEGEIPAVETVIVEVEGEPVIVTATPPPSPPPMEFSSSDPNTLVKADFGEPETFDPALGYETAGGNVIMNVYETLVFYNREKAAEFVPQLALEVPTVENGLISEDGKMYTFNIRQGVKFHDGADLSPADVAFSFVRGLLQGGTASPQWLLAEPFFGIGIADIALLVEAAQLYGLEALPALSGEQISALNGELMDDTEAVKAVDPSVLAGVCEFVKSKIVADDAAGTVTMTLAQAWGPFIPTIAASWGSIVDQDWIAANGGWGGDCANWANYYAITSENSPLTTIANGTGPYMLERWTQGQEVALVRNENYWRTEPAWEGGPSGPAAIERILIKQIDEWGTRFAMVQAGDADIVIVNRENVGQIDPLVGEFCRYDPALDTHGPCEAESEQPLRLFIGAPLVARADLFFNFNIATEGGNPLIGSGQLDGNGIPPDFFSDIHIRKAFNYCFDWETYIEDAWVGEAIQAVGIPLPGMPGYDPDGSVYSYDPDQCMAEFGMADVDQDGVPAAEDDNDVLQTGFRMQVAYNTGNTVRQTMAEILSTSLSEMNENFQIEIIGLPWPTFLRNQRARTLPIFITGWQEDIHDPHNWYVPYLTGTYGLRQSLPEEHRSRFQELINQGVAESDPAARHAIYQQINQQVYELAPQILLAAATQRYYVQRWLQGWYYNPIYPDNDYFYAYSKK